MASSERGRPVPPSGGALPVFRLRDLAMEPRMGAQREVAWMQFTSTVQLRLRLAGSSWEGIRPDEFQVAVCPTELSVKCSRVQGGAVQAVSGKLRREICPKGCWFDIERDVHDPNSTDRFLVIELVKKCADMPWEGGLIFQDVVTHRKAFSWNSTKKPDELEKEGGWVRLQPGRRSDMDDPFATSRGLLCADIEQGQTDEIVQIRIVLDKRRFDEALDKVPYFALFAADCSEKHFRLFIRGDASEPILRGEFGGRVLPYLTTLEVTTVKREVEGQRIAGLLESVPCLDVTVQKAEDSLGEWEEILVQERSMSRHQVQDPIEEMDLQVMKQREPSPDRGDWCPDDFADEHKARADAAFKAGDLRGAIVHYTRALRFTPLSNKLLSNRSAAYLKISKFRLALEDAGKAQRIDPNWSKVYFRQGQALSGLKRFDEALAAFRRGQDLDPELPEWEREMERTKELKALMVQSRKPKEQ